MVAKTRTTKSAPAAGAKRRQLRIVLVESRSMPERPGCSAPRRDGQDARWVDGPAVLGSAGPMRRATGLDRRAQRLAIIAYVAMMFGLTWAPLAALEPLWSLSAEPPAIRLLRASVLYASLMTVQPLIALAILRRWFDARTVDLGLRPPPPRWHALAILGPLALAGAAAALALLTDGAARSAAPGPALDPRWSGDALGAILLLFGFVGTLCMLWVQATTEEIGWRGFLLPRLMKELGPWTGLFVHGAIWGLWYAPLLLATTGVGLPSLARCAGFVVTCSLLGVLLGWIRIATHSILAAASANATLTICAALPLVLQGNTPPRTGIFLPIGWIPLGLAILAVLCSRHRRAIRRFTEQP